MEEKNKNKNKQECPLCSVSNETLDRLKKQGEEKKLQKEKSTKKKKGIWGKIFILILILGLAGFVYFRFFAKSLPEGRVDGENSESVKVGSFAPDFTLEDVYGNRVGLSDFRDKKPVMLVFWATWCGYCAKELPDLKTFAQEHQDKIQVIAIDSGEAKRTIADYIQKENIDFLVLLDEKREVWNQYLVRGTPSHFLIDSQGKIVAVRPGLALRDDLEMMLSTLTELW